MLGNRKKERETESLEVGHRKRERSRRRWAAALRGLLMLALLMGAGTGGWFAWKWAARKAFAENPRFNIQRIVVENPNGILPADFLIQASGVQPGQNLFALNLEQLRRELEWISLVERAEVRRDLPDTFSLRILERKPVLRFAVYFPTPQGSKQTTLYLDKAGQVIELPAAVRDGLSRYAKLPWLTGLKAHDVRVGRAVTAPELQEALKLLAEWELSAASELFELTQVDVSRPQQIALVNRQGSVVVVAPPDYREQLARLTAIWGDAQSKRRVVRLADLSVRQNIPVTFFD